MRFTARFGGVSHPVQVPVGAVLAIYARETGQAWPCRRTCPRATIRRPTTTAAGRRLISGPGDEPTPRRSSHLRVIK